MNSFKGTVLRANYKTANCINDGFIFINGNTIQGLFGLDILRLDFQVNHFILTLHENVYTSKDKMIYYETKDSIYESQSVYDRQIYAPETYIFFNKNDKKDGLSLEITAREYDESRVNEAVDIYRKFISSPYPHIIM